MALFFTKIDCLEAKLGTSSFREYFPNFSGDPTNLGAVVDYIEMRFLNLNQNPGKKLMCILPAWQRTLVPEGQPSLLLRNACKIGKGKK